MIVDVVRWSKPFVPFSILLVFSGLARPTAPAQESFSSGALPYAPQPAQAITPSPANGSQQASTGSLSGTVLDTRGDVMQGASVTLADPSGSVVRTAQSGSDGQFAFTGLQPNVYKLTVTAPGMITFTSREIPLSAGEFHILPPVALSISPVTTSVTVSGNSKKLSEEQVHIAEQQRIVGVIPNFYSSYNWNAPPMLAKQKFQLSIRSIIDPVSFLSVAGIAGAEQYKNVFPAYGGGIRRIWKAIRGGIGESRIWHAIGQRCVSLDLPPRPTILLQRQWDHPVARSIGYDGRRYCER